MRPETPSPKILIVEDDRSTGLAVAKLFGLLGWATVRAGGVAEAVGRLVPGHGFALVVLDLNLPDGDGVEVLKHVRAGLTDPPRVIVTTGKTAAELGPVHALSPDLLLVKPYIWEALEDAARSAVQPQAGKAQAK